MKRIFVANIICTVFTALLFSNFSIRSASAESFEFFDTNDGDRGFTSDLTVLGDELLFFTDDGIHGLELWKTDGTQGNTRLVKDIYPGPTGSYDSVGGQPPTILDGKLFFFADDGVNGLSLWGSDGTEQGTYLVKNFSPDIDENDYLTKAGDMLVFSKSDGSSRLTWKSDGTTSGTMLTNANAARLGFNPIMIGNDAIFAMDKSGVGWELFKSDGTEAGTVLIKDINPESRDSSPSLFVELNGEVYFWADEISAGRNLWKTDGTTAGTVKIPNNGPVSGAGHVRAMWAVNGKLVYFTSEGHMMITDVLGDSSVRSPGFNLTWGWPDSRSYIGPEAILINDILYYSAHTDDRQPGTGAWETGIELWRTDGTVSGTEIVKDIYPGVASGGWPNSSNPYAFSNINNILFFKATDSCCTAFGRSDGTSAGTYLSYPGLTLSTDRATLYKGRVYFSASDSNDISYELAALNLNSILNVSSSGVADVPISADLPGFAGITDYTVEEVDPTTELVLTAPAQFGPHIFDSWSGCDTVVNQDCSIKLKDNTDLTANYVLPKFELTVNSTDAAYVEIQSFPLGFGDSTYAGVYTIADIEWGTTFTLTAPEFYGGQEFIGWSGCDSASGFNCTVNMTSIRAVSVSYTPTPLEDNYEPNNSSATAYDLSSANGEWLKSIDGLGIYQDDDWYKIDVPAGAERIKIELLSKPALGAMTLRLWDQSIHFITGSSSGVVGAVSYDFAVASPGTYFISIDHLSGSGASYNLRWSAISSSAISLMDIDTSFGTDGSTTTWFYDDSSKVSAEMIHEILIAADGGVIALGATQHTYLSYPYNESKYFPILAKFKADGTLDENFGNNGKSDVYNANSWSVHPRGLGYANGSIFVGLDRNSPNDAIEIDTLPDDGSRISRVDIFADFPVTSPETWNEQVYWLVTRNGMPIVGGQTGAEGSYFSADPSALIIEPYSNSKQYAIEFGGSLWDTFYSAVVQPDGKLIAVGEAAWNSSDNSGRHFDWGLARFNVDGSLDTTFGDNGKIIMALTDGPDEILFSVALQTDGKIIARGITSAAGAIARFNTDGSLDSTFATGGVAFIGGQNGNPFENDILIQADDKILFIDNIRSPHRLKRLNADGTLDTTFGLSGIGFEIGDRFVTPRDMKLLPNGNIVIAGAYSRSNSDDADFWIARYYLSTTPVNPCVVNGVVVSEECETILQTGFE